MSLSFSLSSSKFKALHSISHIFHAHVTSRERKNKKRCVCVCSFLEGNLENVYRDIVCSYFLLCVSWAVGALERSMKKREPKKKKKKFERVCERLFLRLFGERLKEEGTNERSGAW